MDLKPLKQFACTVLWLTAILWGGEILAQQTLGGKVVDPSGMPVIGATVVVDGTTKGASTDLDGGFAFAEKAGTPITVSYIGYKPVHTALRQGMIVTLEEDSAVLDDVVVVGYGVQKKETLTGAVTVVSEEMFKEKGALSSPLQALQGQVPGVIITRASSAPGDESWSMSLRGAVSTNTTEPLVIIDGVAYESVNEMRNLNPNDIASINFLKDASAAIYGSRAAGGVVLITTKAGRKGSAKVEYNGSVTIKKVGLMPELMSLDQWADAVIQTQLNDGTTATDVWYKYALLAKAYKGGYIDFDYNAHPFNNTDFKDVADICFLDQDWLSLLFDTGYSTEHNVSISGGGNVATYRISLGYLYDGSTLQWGHNNNQRYNFRINNTFNLSKRLTLESSIGYNRQEQVSPTEIGSVLSEGNFPQPGLPVSTVDGKPYGWGTWGASPWKAELGGDNKLSVSALNISEQLKYDIGYGLTANVGLGYNTSTAARTKASNPVEFYNYAGTKMVKSIPEQEQTYYEQTSSRTNFYSLTAYLNYAHTFAEAHNLSVTVGGQYEKKDYSTFGANVKDTNASLDALLGSGEITFTHKPESMKWENALASVYGRLNYDYKSKYLVEAQMRYDGSSKFLPANRWAFFWGASVGWRISQEGALKHSDWLDELKLRLSYGQVGNQSGISNYDGVQLYNMNTNNGALIGSGLLSTITTSGTLASTTREWERIHNYNVGLDFAFLGNRLSGTVEFFLKKNDNMLVGISYPGVLGINAPSSNAGKFRARGVEGNLTWRDRIGRTGINYYVGGTFTFARTKIVDNGGVDVLRAGFVKAQQGYPLNSVFGLRYAGKIQTEEQLEAYMTKYYDNNGIGMPNNLRLGDHMYADVNGDGKLDHNDYVYLGSNDPEISYSFNAGLSWKGLEVSVVFQGAGNRTIFRVTNDNGSSENNFRIPMRNYFNNSTTISIGKVWSPENPGGHYPTYTKANSAINTYNYQCSSWSAEDGSYIRLKNVTVSYTLPQKWFDNTRGIAGCRIYFTGADLWEHSNINDGWDPEAGRKVSGTGRYPFTRNFTVGANLTF